MRLDDAPCELAGDAERLRQVFVNLVENAVKFTPRGGKVMLRANVSDAPAPGEDDDGAALLAPVRRVLEVSVADTGIGIPTSERSRVFDAFYQVDSSSTREYGGTGLGLSIVKHLVELHGGRVSARNRDGGGATVVVRLPDAPAGAS